MRLNLNKIKFIKNIKRKCRPRIYDGLNLLFFKFKSDRDRIVNDREIRFLGLQRSGNHAIINWIFSQCPELKCYMNFVETDSNPFQTFQRRGTVRQFEKNFFKKFNIRRERLGFFARKNTLLYSYEDEYPQNVFLNDFFDRNHDRWLGRSAGIYDLLLLRDPFNLCASRLKKEDDIIENRYSLRKPEERKIVIEIWKSYAKEFLGETGYLKNNPITVSYNKWCVDAEYRKDLADKLGLEFNDNAINEVLETGGGSSFDRTEKNKQASEMKVLERWKHYIDDEDFLAVFKDKELLELSDRIFGKIPGTEIFYTK